MCACAANLALLALLSFSIHYNRSAILVLCVHLLSEKQLTVKTYSFLISLNYVPSILVPIVIGIYLHKEIDKSKRFSVLLIALFLIIMTSLCLSISMIHERFVALILSMFIFSSASSVVILIQRALTLETLNHSSNYPSSTAVSTGITIAIGNIAKLLGKLTVVLLLELSSIYDVILVVIVISFISFFSGILLFNLDFANRIKRPQDSNSVMDNKAAIMLSLISPNFYSYALIHSIVLSTFHLFINSIQIFMVKNHNFSLLTTAIYGSLVTIIPTFTSPLIGCIMKNYTSYHLESCIIVASLTYASYFYLLENDQGYINPVINIIILSFTQSFLATITLSCSLDNLCVEKRYNNLFYTYAFAIMESLYAIMSVIITAIFGFFSSTNAATDDTIGGTVNTSSLSIILYLYALITGLLLALKVLQKYNSHFIFDQYMQIF